MQKHLSQIAHLAKVWVVSLLVVHSSYSMSQEFDEEQLGAWYMYFFDTKLHNSRWGFQGDIQYRDFELAGDLEQLLLRGGLTYRPEFLSGV
ncbi:MAG: DUF2490 domain-containing protein, partial [Pseudomonadota bacterium]